MSKDEAVTNSESTGTGPGPAEKRGIRGFFEHSAETVRQLMQPPAFRITLPQMHAESFARQSGGERRPAECKSEPFSADEQLEVAMKTLAGVATAIWRAKLKLDAKSQAELPSELRHLPRHIQTAWDALASGHIQVYDPTGQRYVPGMAVNALTFQPLESTSTEIIHETIKPAVYFRDMLIQRADVIVGRPSGESDVKDNASSLPSDVIRNDADSPEQKGPKEHGANND